LLLTLRKHVGEFFEKCVDWFPHVTHVDCHICDASATDGGMTRVPTRANARTDRREKIAMGNLA
jgi:hypothetical protein